MTMCFTCDGSGKTNSDESGYSACPHCAGTGYRCDTCGAPAQHRISIDAKTHCGPMHFCNRHINEFCETYDHLITAGPCVIE